MNENLGHAALTGFFLSLAVHVCTLLGIGVADVLPVVWLLGMGPFALFVPLLLFLIGRRGQQPDVPRVGMILPTWVITVGLGLFAYAFLHVVYFACLCIGDGNPELGGGKYLLVDQGKAAHVVALSTYSALRANALRAFSAHWMLFYFIAYAGFAREAKAAAEDGKGSGND
jgi:hypothetical protein